MGPKSLLDIASISYFNNRNLWLKFISVIFYLVDITKHKHKIAPIVNNIPIAIKKGNV